MHLLSNFAASQPRLQSQANCVYQGNIDLGCLHAWAMSFACSSVVLAHLIIHVTWMSLYYDTVKSYLFPSSLWIWHPRTASVGVIHFQCRGIQQWAVLPASQDDQGESCLKGRSYSWSVTRSNSRSVYSSLCDINLNPWSSCLLWADEGQGADFFIDDKNLRIRPTAGSFLQVTFRVDSIALEPDESFQVTLSSYPPPPAGSFFLNNLDMTIQDPDGKWQ